MGEQTRLKRQAAEAAVEVILPMLTAGSVLGVGTGSTVDLFIDALAPHRGRFRAAVSSSERSTTRLAGHGIQVLDLNAVDGMPCYVDGADEIDAALHMIKGGGGALTREKIVASVAQQFVCIVDESKLVQRLGAFPLPIEVVPMAREAVARQVRAWGGEPHWREGFITDNGGHILDVVGLQIVDAVALEHRFNNLPGVVCCGLFAQAGADLALVAAAGGVRTLRRPG